jgi:endonuclease/exonuclease/phosphatase family metal-dependent hydrolase
MIVAQWNMGVYELSITLEVERRRTKLLAALLTRYKPDLVALQEAPIALVERLLLDRGYSTATSGANRRLVIGWKNSVWGVPSAQPIQYSRALAVRLPFRTPSGMLRHVLVCNVHLRAPAPHGSKSKTIASLKTLKRELEGYRTTVGNEADAEIILGDFNLEPHTPEMYDREELAANRSLKYVTDREASRTKGEWYRPLYNPAWRLYGAKNAPHGTLYCTGDVDEPWYVYDQALFSSDLVSQIAKVELVTKIGSKSLLSAGVSMPNEKVGSDHLPIVWTVPTEMA